jgi:3-(3-hydroxy-phenyl)propionate hydroxylase
MSTANLKRLKERDPKVRKAARDEMRRICADPKRHYEYMLQTSMIASVRRAETIR